MSCNIIKEYVDFRQKNFLEYAKTMMDKYFNSPKFKEYLEVYIDTRYYNNNIPVKSTLEANLNYYLGLVYEKDETKVSKFILELFKMFYYLDDVKKFSKDQNMDDYLKELNQIRIEKLGIKDDNFKIKFTKLIKENNNKLEKFKEAFSTPDFSLESTKTNNKNIYSITLVHHLTIPKLYSDYAINKVYNNGIIAEDKLFIEYYLVNHNILESMLQGNFDKEYLVDFQTNLFSKKEKVKRLLSIMENDLSKELISLKITYEEFLNHKEIIYALMREGYQFCLIITEDFLNETIKKEQLDVFKYLLVNNIKNLPEWLTNKTNLLKMN